MTTFKSFKDEVEKLEKMLIEEALKATGGNVRASAQGLKLPRQTLWNKIKYYKVDLEKYRK